MGKDNVNHPTHYEGKVECIEALESATIGMEGIEAVDTANAIKYLWRWKKKNGIEDLKKAVWYIQHLIKELEVRNAKAKAPEHHPNCRCTVSPVSTHKEAGVVHGIEIAVPHGASIEEVMEAIFSQIGKMEGGQDADN